MRGDLRPGDVPIGRAVETSGGKRRDGSTFSRIIDTRARIPAGGVRRCRSDSHTTADEYPRVPDGDYHSTHRDGGAADEYGGSSDSDDRAADCHRCRHRDSPPGDPDHSGIADPRSRHANPRGWWRFPDAPGHDGW